MLTNVSFLSPSQTLIVLGCFFFAGVQRTRVLSPLTALQPLPGVIRIRSSIVTVFPLEVTVTAFVEPAAAVNRTVVPETRATPVAEADAGLANSPLAAIAVVAAATVCNHRLPCMVILPVAEDDRTRPYRRRSSEPAQQ
ncbi:hypothetical protein [Actinoplanes couchii]|uniref:Secreted protein n=1 Tax=Actinoplanes couchii TaxID=403638 RepID=A0ABQ3XI81_9ACTN|nr:hypothetical protein [Actinoplanes couchii]MDR6324648.1 hypothetical protein [Actinoplanes couchii]GID58201.1 hypothetical protein Aco03nite_066050 [Actinoplanes couchii]